ncbi:LRP2-binding protein [Fasciola hepatica]|uniref:LRP2-binding protein n=1 Tax=Fasciola hepatica TaxID=6192 RepID=A0A4E0R4H0_FASHE|nr:LRP2-binding protein [Fasciola hepatica]
MFSEIVTVFSDFNRYFLLAANDGDRNACIYAQTALGYLYSGPELRDLEKAFYWHTEACGNGSVESQCAIGVMYLYGLGVKQDWTNALICLSEAASRGSLYAKASLVYYYYKRKMFTNAAALANKIIYFEEDAECPSAEYLRNFQLRAKAMACFIYARCLHQGLGIKEDRERAMELYSKSIKFDAVLACRYQRMAQNDEL